MMRLADNASFAKSAKVRHQVGCNVIRPQTIENDEQAERVSDLLCSRTAVSRYAEQGEERK